VSERAKPLSLRRAVSRLGDDEVMNGERRADD
jgi:hypothetical protein